MAKIFDKFKDPKSVTIGSLTAYVSKIPAFYAQRILLALGESLINLDASKIPEPVLLDLLSYTAIEREDGSKMVLEDIGIINELIQDPKDLIELELKVLEYNFGFFFDGSLRKVFDPLIDLLKQSAGEKTLTN